MAIIFEFVFIFLLKQKKHKKYSSVRRSYSTSRKRIDGRKKKEKISKNESTSLTYFDNLKKINKIKAVKTGVTEGFMSLAI